MSKMVGYISAGRARDGKTKYYRVELHDTIKEMRRAISADDRRVRKLGLGPVSGNNSRTLAKARHLGSRYERSHKSVGTVFFNREVFGAGVVAHEMTHAALYFVKPFNFPFVFKHEMDEKLATKVHQLVRRFWKWYYKRNPVV